MTIHEFIRQPAVAGSFYPHSAAALRQQVESYLDQAPAYTGSPAKALIVPHAGYIYSGPVAASAYVALRPRHAIIQRVVLLGPSHRVPFSGLAVSHASHYATPLGLVPIDQSAVASALGLAQVHYNDAAHEGEHSLEVHLPFLQVLLDHFTLIPLVVGDASPQQVAEVLDLLWGGEETLIVISSDLSHYHDYASAQQRDLNTSLAIEALAPERIHYDDACGRHPLNGLLYTAKQRRLQVEIIDVRNSGDTAGSRHRVVGYGAYLLH